MKIGILTFHRADNYGAVLQCYALFKTIKSLGFQDVKVIDYCPSYFTDEYSLFSLKRFIKSSVRGKMGMLKEFILFFIPKLLRRRYFSSFVSRLSLTDKMDQSNISFADFDIVFVGSDQVWNRKLTCGEDKALSGQIRHDNMVLASYAASTEYHKNIIEENEYYLSLIKRFDFISLRENVLVEYFNSLSSKKAQWVLDPTLLFNKEQWSVVCKQPKEDNYLLVYTVPVDTAVMKLAKMIADERGLKIIELVSRVRYVYKKSCRQLVSPNEFLGYFQKASYVVTTSFHGTAFSLVMKKQFCTLMLGRAVDVRAKDLLSNLGLNSRCVSSSQLVVPCQDIDYSIVEDKLNLQRNNSLQYIKSVIGNFSER